MAELIFVCLASGEEKLTAGDLSLKSQARLFANYFCARILLFIEYLQMKNHPPFMPILIIAQWPLLQRR